MVQYKRILTYTLLLLLLPAVSSVRAAVPLDEAVTVQDEEEGKIPETPQGLTVYDHTLHARREVDHQVQYTKDLADNLADDMLVLVNKLGNTALELILATVLEDEQNEKHYKYIFSSKGLLQMATLFGSCVDAHV